MEADLRAVDNNREGDSVILEGPTLVVEVPRSRPPERRYILDVILREFLGLEYRLEVVDRIDVRIASDADPAGREIIVEDAFFESADRHWLRTRTVPSAVAGMWREPAADLPGDVPMPHRSLPVLFGRQTSERGYLERSERRMRLGLDVFGSSFFLLTRYEEAVVGDRDEHGRFPARASVALRSGFLHRPLVNEYVEVLWSLVQWLSVGLNRREHSFAIVPSHDVDRPRWLPGRSWWRVVKDAWRDAAITRDPDLGMRKLVAKTYDTLGWPDRDPCDTFDWIMDVSERLGVASAFYFMTGPTAESSIDRYSIDDPWIRALFRRIASRGHEIGLHTTYATYQDPELTRREYAKLQAVMAEEGVDQPRVGGRQHYLRWSNPHTWQNWEDAGLAYDTTLGFADHVGFRCGCCLEYPTFNLRTRRPLRLRERPLVVMDGSLFNYMNLSENAARTIVADLTKECRRYGGQLTLLWHNSTLMPRAAKDFYSRTLGEAESMSRPALP